MRWGRCGGRIAAWPQPAVGGDVKIRHLEDAYLQGLAGREIEPPKKLKDLLIMPVSDYDGMVQRYAEKHSAKDGFRFRAGKIEPYDARIARSTRRLPPPRKGRRA